MSTLRLTLVYLGALGLLGTAILTSLTGSIPYRGPVIMVCAIGEAALVMAYFVELKTSRALIRLFALGTVFWLLLLFSAPLIDRLTR
ncbi:hypothetical protein C4C32_12660 [Pseudomonas corrugata]|uniref:Oxidase n=1 Tax=Pseudomonas corrugata TaxID=47879 RepID=A0A8B6UXS4_9PSED|nr:hypothetical protein [Pseudomonas corrugata]QTH16701.1 hypothetical protein C4C32_12660 [Pseudomonas corrugata]